MYDEKEQDRLEHLEILKAKGKGAPKKKKSAAGMSLSAAKYALCDECHGMLLTMVCATESRKRPGKKK